MTIDLDSLDRYMAQVLKEGAREAAKLGFTLRYKVDMQERVFTVELQPRTTELANQLERDNNGEGICPAAGWHYAQGDDVIAGARATVATAIALAKDTLT